MEATLQTKNKNFGLSGFILKILAIICMTIDHATWLWFDSIPYETGMILRTIGRISFPLIVFMLCEGYIYMITAYHPNIDKWEKDMKTRRENNEMFYV